jgi:hypothetical protein
VALFDICLSHSSRLICLLAEINISGNPIGEQGARIVMKVAVTEGDRLEIVANNCDFKSRCNSIKFNVDSEWFLR